MYKFKFFLFTAVSLFVSVSCVDKLDRIDSDSSLSWHIDDVEYLDSIVEYSNSKCISSERWEYDEYGRAIERYRYYLGYNYRSEWSYSDGGKTITVTESKQENSDWQERTKTVIKVIVAGMDSCFDYYNKESGRWKLFLHSELKYDVNGKPLSEYYEYEDRNNSKTEYEYDDQGHCILKKTLAELNGEWTVTNQMECSFDEKGNCVYIKTQMRNATTGKMIGDSLVEHSYDNQNRETGYMMMKWDYGESSWTGKQKYALAYDDRGNVIENTIYVWNNSSKEWMPQDKSTKSFDSEGRITSDASYVWRDGEWIGIGMKYEKCYDNNGNLIYNATYCWSATDSCWVIQSTQTDEYDSDGNLIHSVSDDTSTPYRSSVEIIYENGVVTKKEYHYNEDNEMFQIDCTETFLDEYGRTTCVHQSICYFGEWREIEKNYFTYDSAGNRISSLRYIFYEGQWMLFGGEKYEEERDGNTVIRTKYTWDLGTKKWQETGSRRMVTYDEQDRIIKIETGWYRWDGQNSYYWDGDSKTEYTYDSYGNKSGFITSTWNTITKEWGFYKKEEYEFDADGNQLSWASFYYSEDSDSWICEKKWVAEYDSNGNQTLLINNIWTDIWTISQKTISVYDSDGRLSDVISYQMDYVINDWVGSNRTIYIYDPETKTNQGYNLTYDTRTKSWTGKRTERKTGSNGNLIQETIYEWKDEHWVMNTDSKYDFMGNLVAYSTYYKNLDEVAFMETEYIYDSKNRLITTIRRKDGVEVYRKATYYSVHKGIKAIDGYK